MFEFLMVKVWLPLAFTVGYLVAIVRGFWRWLAYQLFQGGN